MANRAGEKVSEVIPTSCKKTLYIGIYIPSYSRCCYGFMKSVGSPSGPFDAYNDTIMFRIVRSRDLNTEGWEDTGHSEPWRRFIGEVFGWGWITINQQDALDGILLSFDGITPQVMLNVMASSIKESLIIEARP
jgi:hypothetical protein